MVKPLLLQYHTRPVTQVRYNRDGDLIVSASNDGNVCLIKAETGDRIGTFHGHEGAVKSVDISRDSSMVVSGSADSRICFYETRSGEVIYTLLAGGIVRSVEFNQFPGRTNLLASCADKFRTTPNNISIWRFWDGRDSENKQQIFLPKSSTGADGSNISNNFSDFAMELLCEISDSQLPMKASSVSFGPFDETIIASFDEGTIYVYKIPQMCQPDGSPSPAELLKCVDAHNMSIKGVQFNFQLAGLNDPNQIPAGERTLMLTASRDKTVKLWETQEYSLLKTFVADRPLNDAVLSPLYQLEDKNPGGALDEPSTSKSKKTGVSTLKDKGASDENSGPPEPTQPRYHVIAGGGIEAREVTTSVEGGFESVFFHLVDETQLCQVRGHFAPINTIGMAPDGKSYITGGEDGLMRLIHFDAEYFNRKDM